MAKSADDISGPRHDRSLLLHGTKRNEVLTLAEVRRYGSDSFGDPNYIKIYGATPPEWYARLVLRFHRVADVLLQSI